MGSSTFIYYSLLNDVKAYLGNAMDMEQSNSSPSNDELAQFDRIECSVSKPTRKIEGYWADAPETNSELPWPKAHQNAAKFEGDFIDRLQKLSTLANKTTSLRGWSRCRLCGRQNGSTEFNYENYYWPQGYLHYIAQHHVRPAKKFFEWVMAKDISSHPPKRMNTVYQSNTLNFCGSLR